MAFVLNVRMTAREGEEDRAAELIAQLAAATRQEPGNIQWVGHRSTENPRTFMVYEQYRDEDAFKKHGQTEHFKSIGLEQLFPLMEGERERNFYETLD
jgi:quinol monooxygenase YgiN